MHGPHHKGLHHQAVFKLSMYSMLERPNLASVACLLWNMRYGSPPIQYSYEPCQTCFSWLYITIPMVWNSSELVAYGCKYITTGFHARETQHSKRGLFDIKCELSVIPHSVCMWAVSDVFLRTLYDHTNDMKRVSKFLRMVVSVLWPYFMPGDPI